uniref:Molecular chaperone DnaK (HSP70) n=1 Tax=Candidatus Kentrum sp. MB TaxID=2138164 RepID=A0A450XVT3_9GAMM|nr:MAG: Molecular chaperone DnaK (HSP70) [Candidatus Kentron sp. MB]VFK33411.1 MAG: Molecular chaperone DnaK (HSP70) [Candidatus Kentron sp. MB]VFK76153.1 MAG: Molecular chaperone DnaK (HSP70) [Candidatus Kentron sp. MB]
MSIAIGIDLGTTNCAVAHMDKSGRPVMLPNRDGASITPSVVCFLPDQIAIGSEAKEFQAAGVGEVAAFFKRQMGDTNFLFYANGRDWTAPDLSALLLMRLKEDAEESLGQSITQAVITVPAYFRNPQREATRAAGEAAGLQVLQLINEPTAAAIAYGIKQGTEQKDKTLLVYDLGGGTFDLTLLRVGKDEIRILNSEGDHELGGKDWDDRIIRFFATRFEEEHGIDPIADALTLTELLARVEQAKRQLTTARSARITITHEGNKGAYELDRATFDGITADLMERTILLTRKVLDDGGVKPANLDGVLLVGGSTRMPMVHDFITRTFGRPPMTGVNVDEAVALGAAVSAAEYLEKEGRARPKFFLGSRRTVDVTNHSLGMIAFNADRTAYINSIILPKNRPIPCVETRPYQLRTRQGGENQLEIFMTQGESDAPNDVTYIGRYLAKSVSHAGNGTVVIDIGYAYDASGTVTVTAKLRESKKNLPILIGPLEPGVPAQFLEPPPPIPAPPHVTVYLTFDLSGSMSGRPLKEAKKAAHRFVENLDLSHCSVGIVAVADKVKTMLKASQNGREIQKGIDGLDTGILGCCNDAHPFDEIKQLLEGVDGPCYAVVLADGVWAYQNKAAKKARACHQAGIEVIAIGFGSADKAFLNAIASSDEAGIFTDLHNLQETFTTIAQVLTERAGGLAFGDKKSGFSLRSLLRG